MEETTSLQIKCAYHIELFVVVQCLHKICNMWGLTDNTFSWYNSSDIHQFLYLRSTGLSKLCERLNLYKHIDNDVKHQVEGWKWYQTECVGRSCGFTVMIAIYSNKWQSWELWAQCWFDACGPSCPGRKEFRTCWVLTPSNVGNTSNTYRRNCLSAGLHSMFSLPDASATTEHSTNCSLCCLF